MGMRHLSRKKNFSKNLESVGEIDIQEDKIAFPAVLGLESAAEIVNTIAILMGKSVFEIPTIPHPCPAEAVQHAENYSEKGR